MKGDLGHGTYRATQTGGVVTLTATGETPTLGYRVRLEPSPMAVSPPEYTLVWEPPDGMAAQAFDPFEVSATFTAAAPVQEVVVVDAAGRHRVPVQALGPPPPGPARLANHFALEAPGVEVTFTGSNLAGQPVLTWNQHVFTGPAVKVEQVKPGLLVSAIQVAHPDLQTITVSVLLPRVRLAGEPAPVRTVAIRTTSPTTIAGPPLGQGSFYETLELSGTASFIQS